jgi:predicted HNH restriction endonuclease
LGRKLRTTFRKLQPHKPAEEKTAEEIVRELRGLASPAANAAYREQSLRIHGLICAKCGREFDFSNRNLLTVHHKDGNHNNNPPDGSNWENLCAYCHEDEHSRGLLADYIKDEKGKKD